MSKSASLALLLHDFEADESGTFSLIFAVSALTLIMAMGVAYDTSRLLSTKSRAQMTSDSIGLVATIYVKNNGQSPQSNSEGFVHDRWYDASAAGVDFGDATATGNSTKFKVVYDHLNGQAAVHTSAEMKPAFLNAFGLSTMTFQTKSIIKYAQSSVKDPASIFLVLDNSGSMAWHDKRKANRDAPSPPNAKPRIQGLKEEVKKFTTYLDQHLEAQTEASAGEFLRMGLTAYSSGLLNHLTVVPQWGTISDTSVNSLQSSGGTDPRTSMALASSWMLAEDRIHEEVNGSMDPLKYVIYMTDGVNNSATATSQTLSTCTSLKSQGVEIYTIGYALEPGYYRAYYDWQYSHLSPSASATAYNFLAACASSEDHFIKAENTQALNAAFDRIGAEIISEVVRIAS